MRANEMQLLEMLASVIAGQMLETGAMSRFDVGEVEEMRSFTAGSQRPLERLRLFTDIFAIVPVKNLHGGLIKDPLLLAGTGNEDMVKDDELSLLYQTCRQHCPPDPLGVASFRSFVELSSKAIGYREVLGASKGPGVTKCLYELGRGESCSGLSTNLKV